MDLHPLTVETIPAAAEVARRIWPRSYAEVLSPEQIDYQLSQRTSEAFFRSYLGDPDRGYDLAVSGDRVIGYCSYHLASVDELRLDQIYVDPDLHGQGFGQQLLDHVRGIATRRSVQRISLTVNRGNVKAITFYRHRGFSVVDDVVMDIGGGFVMDDHIMVAPVVPGTPTPTGGMAADVG